MEKHRFEKAASLGEVRPVLTWLKPVIAKDGDAIAIVDAGSRVSYDKLWAEIETYAAYFWHAGVRQSDKVVLQVVNSKEYIYAMFGLIAIGAVPILTNPALRQNEVSGIASRTAAVGYIHSGKYGGFDYEEIAQMMKQFGHMSFTVSADQLAKQATGYTDYEAYDAEADETAVLMLTGGTTGFPRMAPISHKQIFQHVEGYKEQFGLTSEDVYMAILPGTHKFAFYSPGFMNMLYVGGRIVICKNGSCDEVFPLIEEEKVTITGVVPALAKIWVEYLSYFDDADLSSIRRIIIGGATVEKELVRALIQRFDCEIQPGYGCTEGMLVYNMFDKNSENIDGSYQYFLTGDEELKVIDEAGQEVADGEPGELAVKSSYTIQSYYNEEDNTPERFTADGYYRMGDIVYKAAAEERKCKLFVMGRVADQINRGGEKIIPGEIEDCMLKIQGVKEAVAVGAEDEMLGERICVFLISDRTDIRLDEVRKLFEQCGMASYKIPDQIERIESWPLTPINKIDKKKLKQQAAEGF